MKPTLQPGLEHEAVVTVTEDMRPGHVPILVLSTPAMINWMERTAHELVQPHLDEGETTVGVHVNVGHSAAAKVGEPVTFRARLKEITRRRLLFDVEAYTGREIVGKGTHERAVVNLSKFGGG